MVTVDQLREANRKNSVTELMDEHGITDEELVKLLKEELQATETKCFHNRDARIIYSIPMIAHEPRLRALDLSLRLKGHLIERKSHSFESPVPISLTPEEELEVHAKMEILKARMRGETK